MKDNNYIRPGGPGGAHYPNYRKRILAIERRRIKKKHKKPFFLWCINL